jgi:hypothetical protein
MTMPLADLGSLLFVAVSLPLLRFSIRMTWTDRASVVSLYFAQTRTATSCIGARQRGSSAATRALQTP